MPKNTKQKKHVKLQHRLLYGYLILAGCILVLFAGFFYKYVSEILIENEMDSLNSLNDSFQISIDAVIKDLDDTSANINYSSLMANKLNSAFDLNLTQSLTKDVADLFVTINGSNIKADQINLYDFEGNVMRVGISTGMSSVDTDTLSWMDETKSLGGIKLISVPYETLIYSKAVKSSEWFVSLYRTYNNPYGRTVGAIETVKRCKTVFKSIRTYSKTEETPASVYVFHQSGSLAYPYDLTEEEKKSAAKYFALASSSAEDHIFIDPDTGERQHFAVTVSDYSGWTFISVQSEAVILAPVNRLLSTIALVVCVLLIVAVFASLYLSRTMIVPIKHLKHRFQRLELATFGEYQEENYDPKYDELAELYTAFEHMSSNLKSSMNELIDTRQQEIRSRTLALQSQTNPHFYYNTLSSIMILAENEQNDDIVLLCKNLSSIMRYITDSSSTLVTIKTEFDYVEKYLYCMKVRYQDSLTYSFDVDDDLLDRKIPKLLIQPIVENALKYGTDCIPPWNIQVRGKKYKDRWMLEVIDSGTGFSQEAIEQIHVQMKKINKNEGMPELGIDGLGIANVYGRWKLIAKNRALFEIGNTVDGHGIVSIGLLLENG
ncbi:MAG: sensor histidine kinase [Lachnospiraceae bacterium]